MISPKSIRSKWKKLWAELVKLWKKKNFQTEEEADKFVQDIISKKDLLRDVFDESKKTPLEKAQDLIYKAYEEDDTPKRINLAHKALNISDDCVDAYCFLAFEAETFEEEKILLQKAVEVGRRHLGEGYFKERVGYFWGFHETRPFMRAMEALADCLWFLNQRNECIDIYYEMLLLNPNDNQGIRYPLVIRLLIQRKFKEAEVLIRKYEDDISAYWYYSKAYLYFRQPLKKALANKALIEAMEQNPYVPIYLFQIREMPDELPAYIGFGDENEAVDYVAGAIELWSKDLQAASWLADQHKRIADYLNRIIKDKERLPSKQD